MTTAASASRPPCTGEYTSDYRLWDALSEFAINEKVGMHVHLSETKPSMSSASSETA